MKIGSPLLHSRTQSFGELSWDEEEDGQPDELQVRENVIICGSSYSIKYLVHCLVAGGCKVTLVNPHAAATSCTIVYNKHEWIYVRCPLQYSECDLQSCIRD